MPEPDDRLRAALEGAVRPAGPDGVFESVTARKARRRQVRRMEFAAVPVLALALVGGLLVANGNEDEPDRVFAGNDGRTTTTAEPATTTTAAAPSTTAAAATPTTRRPAAAAAPTYSGRRGGIAFESDRLGGAPQTFVMNPDGSKVAVVADGGDTGSAELPSWLAGGGTLVYFLDQGTHGSTVFSVRPDGTGRRELLQVVTDEGVVAPDGSYIAYIPKGQYNDRYPLRVRRIGSDENRAVSKVGGESNPRWSPNSRELAFSRSLMIVIHDIATGSERIVQTGRPSWDPAWSPDGKRLAFSTDTGLWVVNVDGSGLVQLVDSPDAESDPTWSPDGKRVAFARRDPRVGPASSDIWVIDVATKAQTRLTDRSGYDGNPAWG